MANGTKDRVTKDFVTRLLHSRGGRKLPHWHGTCSLDHWSAEDAATCRRTN